MSSSGKLTTVTSADIVDGTIVDADVATAAAIAVSKLAAGSAGQIVETIGSTPTWRTVPAVRAYHNAAQSIVANALVYVAFNSERYDTAGMHDPVTNNSRLTATVAGLYLITAHFRWGSVGGTFTCNTIANLKVNRTTDIAEDRVQLPVAFAVSQSMETVYQLAAGDYVEVVVAQFHSAAAAVPIDGTDAATPEFMMVRLGA